MKILSLIIGTITLFCTVQACPTQFSPWFDGKCFYIYKSSLETGTQDCKTAVGDLISIHSKEENDYVQKVIKAQIGNGSIVWIGLGCEGGKYVWSDGTPVDYNNAQGACNNGAGISGYVFNATTGAWIPAANDQAQRVLCKYGRQNGGPCYDYERADGSNTCYNVQHASLNRKDAEEICDEDVAKLIAIHDKQTNDAITTAAKPYVATLGGVHIGLQSNASQNQLLWEDGSPVDYENFGRGFPNDLFGHCAAIDAGALNGQWMSTQCASSEMQFACGKPAKDDNITLAPAGCPLNTYYTNNTIIYSPSFPLGSGPVNCTYTLQAPDDRWLWLNIYDIETNECCDKLEVWGGQRDWQILLDNLNGKIVEAYYAWGDTGMTMTLKYTATDGRRARGWWAKVDFKDNDDVAMPRKQFENKKDCSLPVTRGIKKAKLA